MREEAEKNRLNVEGDDVESSIGWTEEEANQMESIILNRTTAPLCLSPSLQTTRLANTMLRATSLRPPKRKKFCHTDQEGEEDENQGEKEEWERMMKLGDEGVGRGRTHAYVQYVEDRRRSVLIPVMLLQLCSIGFH